MITIEDPITLQNFVKAQKSHPMARKTIGDYTIYRCHNDFGPIYHKSRGRLIPYITDLGLVQHIKETEPLIHPIQPDEYRAPEAILGTGWGCSADIWNLGAMVRHCIVLCSAQLTSQIWDLLAGRSLFRQANPQEYSAAQHLADMISLLGEVPPSVIAQEKTMRTWNWSPAPVNAAGNPCTNASEYYGGPFFDDDGELCNSIEDYR